MSKRDVLIITLEAILLASSIALFVIGFGQLFGCSYTLKVDDSNREYIEQYLILEDISELRRKLTKIADKQGLGDWTLYLYYEDGKKEERMYNDGEQRELRDYLWKNGHDEYKSAGNKMLSSLGGILLLLILEANYKAREKRKEN